MKEKETQTEKKLMSMMTTSSMGRKKKIKAEFKKKNVFLLFMITLS